MIRWLWSRMMKWGWDFGRDRDITVSRDRTFMGEPVVRISVYSAMNGRILEMVKPNDMNHVNETKLMLVPEGENLSDTVTMMLLAEGMK